MENKVTNETFYLGNVHLLYKTIKQVTTSFLKPALMKSSHIKTTHNVSLLLNFGNIITK